MGNVTLRRKQLGVFAGNKNVSTDNVNIHMLLQSHLQHTWLDDSTFILTDTWALRGDEMVSH